MATAITAAAIHRAVHCLAVVTTSPRSEYYTPSRCLLTSVGVTSMSAMEHEALCRPACLARRARARPLLEWLNQNCVSRTQRPRPMLAGQCKIRTVPVETTAQTIH